MRKYAWIMIGMLIAASCLCQAYADTITTFDITGIVTPISPQTGTTFSGTLVLDVDAGFPMSGELNFPDFPSIPFDLSGSGSGPTSVSLDFTSSGYIVPINASLTIPTTTGLVGFTGGTFSSTDQVVSFVGSEKFYYDITSFTMTPETSAVPEPSSFTVVLGFGALVFVARRRRLAAGR